MNRQSPRSGATGAVVTPVKTAAQLRMDIKLLEKAVEDRKLLFVDLCEQTNAVSTAGTPEAKDAAAAAPEDPAEEASRLTARNAFLRDELRILETMERQYANDPRVRDKRNEVRLVKMQIAQVEREIDTLQTVKKRRDQGLRAIGRTEEQARRMRGQQHEENSELREEMRQLIEELREVEKADLEVHDRCAGLQDQVKLSVTESEVQRVRKELERQDAELATLAAKEAEWRKRRASVREEDHRIVSKYRREVAKLAAEEERLHNLLYQKDLELKRSYQLVGRYAPVSGLPAVGAGAAVAPPP